MLDTFGLTARDMLTCGCHVHVSVADDEEGVAVLNRIRVWLPVLTAMTTNSPFWQGQDTGYASYRSQVWRRWPSAGPTDVFPDAAAYHRLVDDVLATDTMLDAGRSTSTPACRRSGPPSRCGRPTSSCTSRTPSPSPAWSAASSRPPPATPGPVPRRPT